MGKYGVTFFVHLWKKNDKITFYESNCDNNLIKNPSKVFEWGWKIIYIFHEILSYCNKSDWCEQWIANLL